jgi:ribosomal protein S18 acetylase RimI-like enzyme
MLTIRLADLNHVADAQAVVDLLDMYSRHEFGASKPLTDDVKERLIPGLKEQGRALAFLAFIEDTPVGLALCFIGFSSFRAQPLLNIHDIAVSPEHRGQGIGGALLDAVKAEAVRRGCCKVTLEVRADNLLAQQLYRRVGFESSSPETWFWSQPIQEK